MTDQLLALIAETAGELSAMTVRELRLRHPDNEEGTVSGSQWKGTSKSKLIEEIIIEEFWDDCSSD